MARLPWLVLIAALIFGAPSLWLRATTPILAPSKAAQADVILVFGAGTPA